MQNKYIAFVLSAFLMTGAAAQAEQIQPATPVVMDDAALASYITGRLKLALKDEDNKVDQYCDANGCSVVVQ